MIPGVSAGVGGTGEAGKGECLWVGVWVCGGAGFVGAGLVSFAIGWCGGGEGGFSGDGRVYFVGGFADDIVFAGAGDAGGGKFSGA